MIRKVLPATLALVFLAASPAGAEDPLLSGYAGPGGGDQAVLGSQLIGGGGGKSGGSGGSGSGKAATTRSLQAAPATSASASAPVASGTPSSSSGSSSSGSGAGKGKARSKRSGAKRSGSSRASGREGGSTAKTRPAHAVPTPTYPATRASSGAGGLPLSGQDVLLALLGAGVVAAVAAGTVRLTRTRPEPGI
jgi:hypothetical protein